MTRFVQSDLGAVPRSRSAAPRTARGQKKVERDMRVVQLLNGGLSVAEIAKREGVTAKRMRALIEEILARRAPEPPAFAALQVNTLLEALRTNYDAMSATNLRAIDRVILIVRELDRWRGFGAVRRRSLRRRAGATPLSRSGPPISRPKKAPQLYENTRLTPGNAPASTCSSASPKRPLRRYDEGRTANGAATR